MKKISSTSLFFMKKIFPILWFGILGTSVAAVLVRGAFKNDPLFLIVPCGMAIFGYFLMQKLVWDLADEVYDCGDALLIKNAGQQEMIPFSDIMHVNVVTMMNPPRITLRLVRPGKFGPEVSFSPATSFSLNPFAKNQVAEDLITRVDRARFRRTA